MKESPIWREDYDRVAGHRGLLPCDPFTALAMSSLAVSAASAPFLPGTVIASSPSFNWFGGSPTKWGDHSPNSLPRFRSRRLSRTASGLGDLVDTLGGVAAPMRQPVWWLLRRCQGGARGADRAEVARDMSGGWRRCVRGGRQLYPELLSKEALPFGFHPDLEASIGRPKPLTRCGASSGRGGDAKVGSREEGLSTS